MNPENNWTLLIGIVLHYMPQQLFFLLYEAHEKQKT